MDHMREIEDALRDATAASFTTGPAIPEVTVESVLKAEREIRELLGDKPARGMDMVDESGKVVVRMLMTSLLGPQKFYVADQAWADRVLDFAKKGGWEIEVEINPSMLEVPAAMHYDLAMMSAHPRESPTFFTMKDSELMKAWVKKDTHETGLDPRQHAE